MLDDDDIGSSVDDPGNDNFSSTSPATADTAAGVAASASAPAVQPAAQPKPTFFKGVIKSMGLALARGAINGVVAGVEAPRNAQGPAIAAQTAANRPQQQLEQKQANQKAMDTQTQDKLTIAMTQLKLHQMQMITSKLDEDQQNAIYNTGRDAMDTFVQKGKVDVLATGDYGSVTAEFTRRQADAKANGQPLLPLQILPAPGSSASKPVYALASFGKDRLTDAIDITFGAADLGYSEEDFKAAGLSSFKFHAPADLDQQKALLLMTQQYNSWAIKSETIMANWKKNQANNTVKTNEGAKNRATKYTIAQLQQAGANARKAMPSPQNPDKDVEKAVKDVTTAAKNLSTIYAKPTIGGEVTGGQGRAEKTAERAYEAAQANLNALIAKNAAANEKVSAKVPKGTVATADIIKSYLMKNGNDKLATRQALINDGYTIPPKAKQ
jgi:hypothetical protein